VNATEATRQSTRAIPSRLVNTWHGATNGPPALVHLRDGPVHLLRFVAVPWVVSRAVGSDAVALLVWIRDLAARLRAAMIETMPLENAAEAYAKMMSGKAHFRIVLTVDRCPAVEDERKADRLGCG
jgi:hypothetical protein